MTTLPTELRGMYDELSKKHSTHLLKHGVTMPGDDTQQAVALICLYKHEGALVSLQTLRDFVRSHWAGKSQDIQPRHLKYAGWHILLSGKSGDVLKNNVTYYENGEQKSRAAGQKLPNGYLMLVTSTDPSPDFVLRKRRGTVDRENWESIKASYEHKCAVCREKRNLEKGHKDPHQGLSLENIIPMCSECNNWASSDLVFDDSGRIVALASTRFIQKSDLEVKLKIFDELSRDKMVNPSPRSRK